MSLRERVGYITRDARSVGVTMGVLYFLKERTSFIRYYYENAAKPFCETMSKIQAGEAPFDHPPYSEDGEPPFMEKWMAANTALGMLGRSCVSMLSASLQLYFRTWEHELGVTCKSEEHKQAFNKGFLRGYRSCFGNMLHLSWNDCPADFGILEQVILARHRDLHPDHIETIWVDHAPKDRKKYPQLFFVSETDQRIYADPTMAEISWMNPAVHVSRDMLFTAIEHVEALAKWLEERMLAVKYRK